MAEPATTGPTGRPGTSYRTTWPSAGSRRLSSAKITAWTYAIPQPARSSASVEGLTAAETDAAIVRAAAAFETWRAVAPGDRARLLRRFAAAVDARARSWPDLEVANAGHVIGNARWEAGNVRDVIEYYAAAPERLRWAGRSRCPAAST